MNSNIKFALITLLLLASIIAVSIYFQSNTTEIKYIKGKDSVVTITQIDTVFIPNYFIAEKIISDTVHIIHFNSDSSIVSDTVIQDRDTLFAEITTYPKIDSLKYDFKFSTFNTEITKIDSIWITRVDTLRTTATEPTAWYNNFLTGVFTTVVTILVIIGL